MKANLHLHSRFSDGTLWPSQIVFRARKTGLTQIALTDHDCMEGVESFLKEAGKSAIQAIPGVEIDCASPEIQYDSEILGYFPQKTWAHTREFCLERMQYREKRIKKLISQAAEFYKTDLSFPELKTHKIGIPPLEFTDPRVSYSKPDLFEYLKYRQLLSPDLKYPKFKDLPFLARGKEPRPTVPEIIEIILRDGGIPVLPHPGLIFKRDVQRMEREGAQIFAWFKQAGILAIECNYYGEKHKDNTREINCLTQKFARELDLKITWGSDCHGPEHENDTMEKFWGPRPFPFTVFKSKKKNFSYIKVKK